MVVFAFKIVNCNADTSPSPPSSAATPGTATSTSTPHIFVPPLAPKVYTSSEGYSIEPPADWKMAEHGYVGTDMFCFFPKQSAKNFYTNINALRKDIPKQTTEADIDRMFTNATAQNTTLKVKLQQFAVVDGDIGLHVIIHFPQQSLKIMLYSEEYLIIHQGKLYEFTYTAPLGDQDDHLKEFRNAVKSVKWIPITETPAIPTPKR